MSKSIVTVIKTHPEGVLDDIGRAMHTAGMKDFLPKDREIILKDNISWHFPYLSANTTPWQLEGAILALKAAGLGPIVAVHNNTVVTNPHKGGVLNRLTPVYRKYGIRELYNFLPQDISWTFYRPKARMRVLDKIYPGGDPHPGIFHREEHHSSADRQDPHLHDDDGGDEERLRGPSQHEAPLYA